MESPGIKNLGDVALAAINAATAATVVTSASDEQGATQGYVDQLRGTLAALLSVNFNYGSGGDTLKVIISTTPDQGTTWIEVVRLAFTTASAHKVVNLCALTPVTTPYTPVALSDDSVKDGVFGDRWRVQIVKGAGAAYAGNTSLAIRGHFR